MKQLIAWLDKKGIPYRKTEEWSLIFSGNHPDGVYVDEAFYTELTKYAKRNTSFRWEWRGHYTSLYCIPA